MASFRIAHSLDQLRTQVNELAPRRSKKADGWIGDRAHSQRTSDHNPHVRLGNMGIVTALDLTHDAAGGFHAHDFAEHLRRQRDNRLKYVISAGRIFSATTSPWTWRRYTGSNGHHSHMHVSVVAQSAKFDSRAPWNIGMVSGGTAPPAPPGVRPTLRRGSTGEHVRTVQRLLAVGVDGQFGTQTDTAVRGFQRARSLTADGIVGPRTWAELDELQQVPVARMAASAPVQPQGLLAAVLVPDKWPEDIGIAIADPEAKDQQIEVTNVDNGRVTICDVIEAEIPPEADIGLTQAAADEIGIDGQGRVTWAIADEEDEGE